MDEKNKLRIKLWARDILTSIIYTTFGVIFVMPISLYLLKKYLTPIATAPIKIEADKVRNSLGTLVRAQQAYFMENRSFFDNHVELEIYLIKSDYYQITTEAIDNMAFSYAVPNADYHLVDLPIFYEEYEHNPLYSYVTGISYSRDRQSFEIVTCINQIPNSWKT